jgi:hypothetical protein
MTPGKETTMTTSPTAADLAAAAPVAHLPSAPAHSDASRLDWLFRDALRNRRVHPLMELVRRYRQRDAS